MIIGIDLGTSNSVCAYMSEKGPEIIPQRDFKLTQDPAYLTSYIKSIKGKHLSLNYVEGLGGGSGFYEMVSLRAPSSAFEQKDDTGNRIWPATMNRSFAHDIQVRLGFFQVLLTFTTHHKGQGAICRTLDTTTHRRVNDGVSLGSIDGFPRLGS